MVRRVSFERRGDSATRRRVSSLAGWWCCAFGTRTWLASRRVRFPDAKGARDTPRAGITKSTSSGTRDEFGTRDHSTQPSRGEHCCNLVSIGSCGTTGNDLAIPITKRREDGPYLVLHQTWLRIGSPARASRVGQFLSRLGSIADCLEDAPGFSLLAAETSDGERTTSRPVPNLVSRCPPLASDSRFGSLQFPVRAVLVGDLRVFAARGAYASLCSLCCA